MLVPQTYPLYIATLNDYLGVIESGRIIAWETTDRPEAVLVPIFVWFGPDESTTATIRPEPGLVQFVGDSLDDVEHRARMRWNEVRPDAVTADNGPPGIDDDQPPVDYDEVARRLREEAAVVPDPPGYDKPDDEDLPPADEDQPPPSV